MKVLLLNPFSTAYPDDPAGVRPILGLGYLAGYLEKNDIDVSVLDIFAEGVNNVKEINGKIRYGLEEEEIKRRIKELSPRVVGITCQSTLHARDAHETARIVKGVDENTIVLIGGAHPSSNPREVLKDKNINIVVKGEGEATFLALAEAVRDRKPLTNIPGTFARRGGKIIENPTRPLFKNIDGLPFPAYHLLPMEIYFREISEKINYAMRDRVMMMCTSRGCPGNCVYCAVRTVWGRRWRGRSPKNVVDEIELLMNDYGVNEIHFLDDSMSVDMSRLEGICDEIIGRGLDVKWTTPNGIAIWLLNEDLIGKMKKSGCYRLTFGLESGNYETLHNFIGKHYEYDHARRIISFASRIGLWTVGTFIIGFPHEKRESIEDTISFAISTDLDFAVFYIANPFPGTPMYEIYLKEGLLPETGALDVVRGCKTKHFTHEDLTRLQGEAFSRFLKSRMKRPWRFLSKIRSLEDFAYGLKLGRNMSKLFFNQALVKTKGIAALWK